MTAEGAPAYVLIWREPSSPRLRTWVDEGTFRPLALPLDDISPTPTRVITSTPDFDAFLTDPDLTADDTAAVLSTLVTDGLGWELTSRSPTSLPSNAPPHPASPAPAE